MKKHLFKVVALPFLFLSDFVFSQSNTSKIETTVQAQFTVMVIPRTNGAEDIKTVLDHSVGKRVAVAKVKDVFQKRGYNIIDYFSWMNDVKTKMDSISRNDSHSTAKSVFFNLMQPDIKVEVDCNIINRGGDINSVIVPMECYDPATMLVLARSTEECSSSPYRNNDTAALVMKALGDKCIENFLNSIEEERRDEIKNGHPIKVFIEASNSSDINLYTKIDSQTVRLIIIQWIKDHTVNDQFFVNGSTKTILNIDNIRIPYFNSHRRINKSNTFGDDLTAYLYEKGIEANNEIRGGAVYITLKSLKKP